MATRRMLSKSISTSKKVTRLYESGDGHDKSFAVLLYTWLQPHLDDFGRYDAEPFTIKFEVIPTFLDKTEKAVQDALNLMQDCGLLILYEANGRKVLQVANFEEHQTGLNKRTKSRYPDPPS